MEGLIAAGRLRASREVQEEILYENAGLRDWLKAQPDLYAESDDRIQRVVTELMIQYHNHDKLDKGINGADPFVIGLAASTQSPGSLSTPRSPVALKTRRYLGSATTFGPRRSGT